MKTFEGFASFSEFIASDTELSLFRRFDRLNARNLLYLQSELLEAEHQLSEFDEEDFQDKSMDVIYSAKCWETFAAKADDNSRERQRMHLIKKVRALMKEYQEALLLRSQILKLDTPGNRVMAVFSNWFQESKPFVGIGRDLLQDHSDFVTLSMTEEQDRLSRLLQHIGGRYLAGMRHATSSEVKYYSERTVQKLIAGVSVVLAALLLEGAIVALYYVTNPKVRLGLLAVFTCIFAASMGLLTNARRSEMFGATAAYAAVLVVFVSGNLGGPSN